jgi:hypothetical protein
MTKYFSWVFGDSKDYNFRENVWKIFMFWLRLEMFIYFSEHFFDHNFKSCFFWLNLTNLIILKQQKFSCNVTKKFFGIFLSLHKDIF